MHVSNEGEGAGTFNQMMQLQVEFQTRLAEETMRYLRRMQGVFEPHAPGTVVRADDAALTATASIGATAELRLELENRQRVHASVIPSLSPLMHAGGTIWFPETEVTPPTRLMAPGETAEVVVNVSVPSELEAGVYRGSLVLQGFHARDIPVSIEAQDSSAGATTTTDPAAAEQSRSDDPTP